MKISLSVFLGFLLFLASCGESKVEFILRNSFDANLQSPVCLNSGDSFLLTADSSLFHLYLFFKSAHNKASTPIDTIDTSPYGSTLHIFESQKGDSFIVLWETESEYSPHVYAYYVKEGQCIKIGELKALLPCQSCESYDFPIREMRIIQEGKNIEISFLKEVYFKSENSADWQLYKAGTGHYLFNTKSTELKFLRE